MLQSSGRGTFLPDNVGIIVWESSLYLLLLGVTQNIEGRNDDTRYYLFIYHPHLSPLHHFLPLQHIFCLSSITQIKLFLLISPHFPPLLNQRIRRFNIQYNHHIIIMGNSYCCQDYYLSLPCAQQNKRGSLISSLSKTLSNSEFKDVCLRTIERYYDDALELEK